MGFRAAVAVVNPIAVREDITIIRRKGHQLHWVTKAGQQKATALQKH